MPAVAACENRKEPNQHRVVLSRLETTFSAAKKKTSWDELTQSATAPTCCLVFFYDNKRRNAPCWHAEQLRRSSPSFLFIHFFFPLHPPRVSQAHRWDCSIPLKLHRLQHRTHLLLLLLPEDHAGENDSNRRRSARRPLQGRRAFVRMFGGNLLSSRDDGPTGRKCLINFSSDTLKQAHIGKIIYL